MFSVLRSCLNCQKYIFFMVFRKIPLGMLIGSCKFHRATLIIKCLKSGEQNVFRVEDTISGQILAYLKSRNNSSFSNFKMQFSAIYSYCSEKWYIIIIAIIIYCSEKCINNLGKRLLQWKALQIYFENSLFRTNGSCRMYTGWRRPFSTPSVDSLSKYFHCVSNEFVMHELLVPNPIF